MHFSTLSSTLCSHRGKSPSCCWTAAQQNESIYTACLMERLVGGKQVIWVPETHTWREWVTVRELMGFSVTQHNRHLPDPSQHSVCLIGLSGLCVVVSCLSAAVWVLCNASLNPARQIHEWPTYLTDNNSWSTWSDCFNKEFSYFL